MEQKPVTQDRVMFDNIRRFLDRNKIFFETVTASLLSLMAVIVAIGQMRTASQQTELLSLQTHIAEAQALPQFDVGLHQRLNQATQKFDDDYLTVHNRGGPVRDLYAETAYFFIIEADAPEVGYRKLEMPIHGYFGASFLTAASVGDLITMEGNHNNADVVALSRGTREIATGKKWSFANIDQRLILRLHYRDVLDREHDDYFQVPVVGAGFRIPREEGAGLLKKWHSSTEFELSRLSPEKIITLVAPARITK